MSITASSLNATLLAVCATAMLQAAEGNFTTAIVGSASVDKNPVGANLQYTLRLVGSDWSSIGFHDAGHSISSIKYMGSSGFVIGGDDGWGVKPVQIPGVLTTYKASTTWLDSPGRLHLSGEEILYMLNKQGVIVSKAWGGNGNLTVEGNHTVNGYLLLNGITFSSGRMHLTGNEDLFLLHNKGVTISKGWGGNGCLTVEGMIKTPDIHTAHLLVTGSWWADHVFDDGYRLMPLSEVKAFVREHGHLPEIPDAAAIKRDGIAVDDMLARHMQKIEELTLHAIAQEEVIQDQVAVIAEQKAAMVEQKTVLAEQKTALATLSARLAAIERRLAQSGDLP